MTTTSVGVLSSSPSSRAVVTRRPMRARGDSRRRSRTRVWAGGVGCTPSGPGRNRGCRSGTRRGRYPKGPHRSGQRRREHVDVRQCADSDDLLQSGRAQSRMVDYRGQPVGNSVGRGARVDEPHLLVGVIAVDNGNFDLRCGFEVVILVRTLRRPVILVLGPR